MKLRPTSGVVSLGVVTYDRRYARRRSSLGLVTPRGYARTITLAAFSWRHFFLLLSALRVCVPWF